MLTRIKNLWLIVLCLSGPFFTRAFQFNLHRLTQEIEESRSWHDLAILIGRQARLAIYVAERSNFYESDFFTIHWDQQVVCRESWCVNRQKMCHKEKSFVEHCYRHWRRKGLGSFFYYLTKLYLVYHSSEESPAQEVASLAKCTHQLAMDLGCAVMDDDGRDDSLMYDVAFSDEQPEANLNYVKNMMITSYYAFNSFINIDFSKATWSTDGVDQSDSLETTGEKVFPYLSSLTGDQMHILEPLYRKIFCASGEPAEQNFVNKVHQRYHLFDRVQLTPCDDTCETCWHKSMVKLFS